MTTKPDSDIRWKLPWIKRMGHRWWDVHLGRGLGYLVVGKDHDRGKFVIYWSPNGTPWHHAARNIVGRVVDNQCVCSERCLERTGQMVGKQPS